LVTGTTLIIDLPYPGYPDNMGHWAETLLPVYSALSRDEWRRDVVRAGGAPHLDTILFSNLRRQQLQVVLVFQRELSQPAAVELIDFRRVQVTGNIGSC